MKCLRLSKALGALNRRPPALAWSRSLRDEGLRVEGTSVNVWALMPRRSCDEARYASQSEAQDILSGA
jgi:hypothetical protein